MLVFQSQGVSVYAGGSSRDANISAVDLVVDLADNIRTWRFPEGWQSSRYTKQVVSLYIQDYKAPPRWAGLEFWTGFWADLTNAAVEKVKRNQYLDVLVMCQGGHGRTGTVVTCLALAADVVPGGVCPVAWVRERYCHEAVESGSQLDYIEQVFGWPVTSGIAVKPWMGGKATVVQSVAGKVTGKVEQAKLPIEKEDDEDGDKLAMELTGKSVASMTDSEFLIYMAMLDELDKQKDDEDDEDEDEWERDAPLWDRKFLESIGVRYEGNGKYVDDITNEEVKVCQYEQCDIHPDHPYTDADGVQWR